MATLEERVSAYIGVNNIPGNTEIDQFLKDGATKHLRYLTMEQQQKFATAKNDSGSGVDVTDSIVVSVNKGGYPSIEYPANRKQQIQDSDSIHKATEQSPAHIVDGGTLSVYPGGGEVLAIDYPTIDADVDTEITVLPNDLEDATVMFAAIQTLNKNLSNKVDSVTDTITMPTDPSLTAYPSPPTITISSVSTSATSISALPTAPTFSAPSKPTELSGDITDYDNRFDDDDVEQARTALNRIQTELEEYQSDINLEVQSFEADTIDYNTEVQQNIEQAKITLREALKDADNEQAKEIQQAQADLNKFQAQVQQVASENRETIQKFQAEVEKESSRFQLKLQGAVADLDSTIKQLKSLKNEYNEIIAPYVGGGQ